MPGEHLDEEAVLRLFSKLQEGVAARQQEKRDLIDGLGSVAKELETALQPEWQFEPNSAADTDSATTVQLGADECTVFALVQEETHLLARALADHLRGLRSVIDGGDSPLSAVVVARAAFEAGLRAESLVDATCDSDVRLRRALNRRLARLHGHVAAEGLLGSHGPNVGAESQASQVEAITKWASARGLNVNRPKFGAPVIGKDESVASLAEKLLEDGSGAYFWKALSSTSHGELRADVTGWLDIINDIGGAAPSWLLFQWTVAAAIPPVTMLQETERYLGSELDASAWALVLLEMWRHAASLTATTP